MSLNSLAYIGYGLTRSALSRTLWMIGLQKQLLWLMYIKIA